MKCNARRAIGKAVLETLEGRTLMSANIALHHGVLTLHADANTPSRMQVEFTADQRFVRAYTTGAAHTYARAAIKELDFIGSNKDDMIYVDPRLGIPAKIDGGAGNDTIKGGTGIDTIDGGPGNDLIYGRGFLSGGAGNDTIWGGDGHNVIHGGSGDDLLYGGNKGNIIFGGDGNDTLVAGAGRDQLIAGTGNDVLYDGPGHATLVGGMGHDTLYGRGGHATILTFSANSVVYASGHDVVQHYERKVRSEPSPVPPPLQNPPPVVTPPVVVPPVVTPPVVTPPPVNPGVAPQPVIQAMETTVLAGEGIDVNGLNSVLHTGDALTAKYHWNFGDVGSKYNDLTGWNAGHVYDDAGTYTITLSITDAAGNVASATQQVTVLPDNRPVIYVDANGGSDTNSGSSPDQAVQTVVRAFQLAGSDSKVEFHRGQTFPIDIAVALNGHDMYVGAYGSGSNPDLLRGAGNGSVVLFLTPHAQNVTIENLTFDSIYPAVNGIAPKIPVTPVWADGTNVVVRDNTFLNVCDAVNGSMQPHGVIVVDNTAPLDTGIRGYFCWVDGTDWSILGNTVANSTREHDIRANSMATSRVLIADNNLTNLTRPQDKAEVVKTTINVRAGHYIYVTNNVLNDGTVGFGPGPYQPSTDVTDWIVVDQNYIHDGQLLFAGAVHHALASNNVLDFVGTAQISVRPYDPNFADRYMSDVTITHNTGLNSGTTGDFLQIMGSGSVGVLTVTDNLYVAPRLLSAANMSGAVIVQAPDLSVFKDISGNVWPAPSGINHDAPAAVNYVWGEINGPGWQSPEQWNANPVVNNDQFQNANLPAGTYQLTLPGGAVGAIGDTPLATAA